MKTILCLSVTLIGFIASVATASAFEENVALVTTSHSLRVASVRAMEDDAPWYIMQQAFATSLAASLSVHGKDGMPVKMVPMGASHAAEELSSGECDAVLVLGESLPSDFKSSDFASYRAVSQIGTPVRTFYFVLRNSDPAMKASLCAAFDQATSAASFQDTIGRASAMRVIASNLSR